MLRITVQDEPGTLTFRLEGRLAGSWVRELQDCWQRALAAHPQSAIRLDLTQVTSIDEAGKAFLAASHAHGAELIPTGCLMRAIVAEIGGALSRLIRKSGT
jgi:anti-anti-sigma regulatory factor